MIGKICNRWTVGGPLLMKKSPTCAYICSLGVKNYIQRRTHCEKACCNLRWFFVNARTAWLACVLDRALQCQGRENYSRLFPTKVYFESNLVWSICHWGTWLIFLLGYIFLVGEVPREHSDQLNAKDEKIIQDYSQQRCILNQTSSGEPCFGGTSCLGNSHWGTSYWGIFLWGKRYLPWL